MPADSPLSDVSLRAARSRAAIVFAALAALSAPVAIAVPGCAKRSKPDARVGEARAAQTAVGGAADNNDRIQAPPLDGATAWLGTDRPLTLESLRGHVVILDFWTYCCVNCMHVLPELRRVERQFAGQPVVVIGVHSGKFDAEKDASRIRAAMRRYDVHHPVVVDSAFAIWQAYGVRAWPTLAVIGPTGELVAMSAGEPTPGLLGELVDAMLQDGRRRGVVAERPIAIHAPEAPDTGPLAFPGGVAVGPRGQIAIADSNHHRIVILDAQGAQVDVAGSGIAGSADGSFESAALRRPQGLTWDPSGTAIYVADTENHQLRMLDLVKRRVTTLAGTGAKGTGDEDTDGDPRQVALRSPWDVALDPRERTLYVAMAGAHQIWTYDLDERAIAVLAGTGAESIDDGPAAQASFSQPSGLSLAGRTLYVADSETSAIRAIDLDGADGDDGAAVRTLVGKGLFDFGDADGVGDVARLQHALGVVAAGDAVYIADTYNNKLKRLDPGTRAVTTVVGGATDALFEPGDVAALPDGRLLVADTNNHRLRAYDPRRGRLVDFPIRGVRAPDSAGLILADAPDGAANTEPTAGARAARVTARGALGPGSNALLITPAPPPGGELTEGAPLVVESVADVAGIALPARIASPLAASALPVRVPIDIDAGATGPIELELSYYWCTEGDEGACVPERARLTVDLDIAADAPPGEAKLTHTAR